MSTPSLPPQACATLTSVALVRSASCGVHFETNKQDAPLEWKLQQSPCLTRTYLIGSFNPTNDLMAGNLCDVHERCVSACTLLLVSNGDNPSLMCAVRL